MNARRYPRTMEGAFGPYHRSSVCPIEPMPSPRPFDRADVIVLWGSLFGGTAILAFLLAEWLA